MTQYRYKIQYLVITDRFDRIDTDFGLTGVLTFANQLVRFRSRCIQHIYSIYSKEISFKMNFSGKVALVTGASSGIGADAARHLAKLGAGVAIVGRNTQRLNAVAEQILASGSSSKLLSIVADVTMDAERIINETIETFGRLDILVNSAGIFGSDSVDDFDANGFDLMMDVNLKSAIVLTNLAVPHLAKTKGNIVNVSSILSTKAWGNYLTYCVSKAGIDQFTKCAAIGLADKGIRVNAINPAMVRTPMSKIAAGDMDVDEFIEQCKGHYLVGRIGEVSDTSAAIAYLANESFINGVLLPVDGGFAIN